MEAVDYKLACADSELHARIVGTAANLYAVVLEAGNGARLESWDLVARQLSPHLRVLSYERAGIGASEGQGASSQQVAARLAALLDSWQVRAYMRKPVILAGHSLGGLYARYFAATHPQDVAGLVLVDATPEDFPVPGVLLWLTAVVTVTLHLVVRIGFVRSLLMRLNRNAPCEAVAAQMRDLSNIRHVRAVLEETRTLEQTQRQVAALGLPKSLPVLCVSAGKHGRWERRAAAAKQRSHDKLAAAGLPPYSHHHCIPGATHTSLLTDPEHAATLGKLMLEFAERISGAAPLHLEQAQPA